VSVRIAPSVLASDLSRIADSLAIIERGGADLVHVDVMDGRFVPNITMGQPIVKAIKKATRLPLDVHLMIEAPERYLGDFIDAGAKMLTVHAEVSPHLHRTLARIRELGALAGVAINPSTPVAAIGDVLDVLDYVLVMSVNPGFGGQSFIPHAIEKVAAARELIAAAGMRTFIEVDGGVDAGNAAALVRAGATVLVAGTSVFGAKDPAAAIGQLRAAAGAA
jgi:ribulose-phosphate 3-epimerase